MLWTYPWRHTLQIVFGCWRMMSFRVPYDLQLLLTVDTHFLMDVLDSKTNLSFLGFPEDPSRLCCRMRHTSARIFGRWRRLSILFSYSLSPGSNFSKASVASCFTALFNLVRILLHCYFCWWHSPVCYWSRSWIGWSMKMSPIKLWHAASVSIAMDIHPCHPPPLVVSIEAASVAPNLLIVSISS